MRWIPAEGFAEKCRLSYNFCTKSYSFMLYSGTCSYTVASYIFIYYLTRTSQFFIKFVLFIKMLVYY